jgi:hypothetical protein
MTSVGGLRGRIRLATFTVQLEIGPETRALLERLVEKSAIQIELGPKTLAAAREVLTRERPDARP